MAQNPIIYPGSSSFIPGQTPFGFYDDDDDFRSDADKVAKYVVQRLGYPLVDIELQDINIYSCFEESVTEYSAQVNQFNIKDNILSLQGQETGSGADKTNLTHRKVTPTIGRNIQLAEQYGT